jgi:hypothetical protein
MSDIVDRLRYDAEKARRNWQEVFCVSEDLAEEAADEIEKLRAAMHDLAGHVWRGDWDKLKPETRAALGEKQ